MLSMNCGTINGKRAAPAGESFFWDCIAMVGFRLVAHPTNWYCTLYNVHIYSRRRGGQQDENKNK